MTSTINYLTQVISVPQSDLVFVSGTTYTLDINVFRLVFKDIEDDSTGIPYVDTHSHNGKVIISDIGYEEYGQQITMPVANGSFFPVLILDTND